MDPRTAREKIGRRAGAACRVRVGVLMLRAGMRITVIMIGILRDGFYPYRGSITRVFKNDLVNGENRILWRIAGGQYGESLKESDEGVTWIRGHHADNSEAITALKAAAALVR